MEKDDNEINQVALQIISLSGSAKSLAIEAIREYKMKNIDSAEELLKESQKQIKDVHKIQRKVLEEEMNNPTSLMMVHAQDHLMNTILLLDIIKEILL